MEKVENYPKDYPKDYPKGYPKNYPIPPNPTQSHPMLPNATQYSDVELEILKLLKANPKITQSELAEKMKMKVNRLKYYLNELRKAPSPAIRHIGTTRNGYWEVLVEIP